MAGGGHAAFPVGRAERLRAGGVARQRPRLLGEVRREASGEALLYIGYKEADNRGCGGVAASERRRRGVIEIQEVLGGAHGHFGGREVLDIAGDQVVRAAGHRAEILHRVLEVLETRVERLVEDGGGAVHGGYDGAERYQLENSLAGRRPGSLDIREV